MTNYNDSVRASLGPVNAHLGVPVTTKPATAAKGIFNNTIAASNTAEKVASALSSQAAPRRAFIYNPSDTEYLAFTTRSSDSTVADATMQTMTATAAGGNLNGTPVPPRAQVEVILPWNAELWLAATANGARYQLTLTGAGH